ncbi:MAG: TRAP transporter large permease [Candidatus Eiseniibacteriota bacterium]
MEWYWVAGIMVGTVLCLMAIGIPIAFGFFITNVIGTYLFMGGNVGMVQMIANMTVSVSSFALVPVPLFLLMGSLFFRSGLASRVLDALDMCFGAVPGRLSYVTVTSGTIFAALSGSSMANTGMMGTLMVPEMLRRGYKKHMALGPILGSGGLAVIIPPSGLAVLLGSLAHIDIGALLIAGVVPGVLLAFMYATLIFLQVTIDPKAAPNYDVANVPFLTKLRAVSVNVLPMGFIILLVIGSILGGVATPTESAALGAVGVLILMLVYRVMRWETIRQSLDDAFRVTAMSFLLIMASTTFSQIMAFSGASSGMATWAIGFNLPPVGLLLIMVAVLLFLGMFMDQLSMMLLTFPVFVPLAQTLGFDLVWYGIIMLLSLEVGFTTPPFGLLLFVMVGVAPKGTTLMQVSAAALPYICCTLLLIGLIIAFPQLALTLPGLMAK